MVGGKSAADAADTVEEWRRCCGGLMGVGVISRMVAYELSILVLLLEPDATVCVGLIINSCLMAGDNCCPCSGRPLPSKKKYEMDKI